MQTRLVVLENIDDALLIRGQERHRMRREENCLHFGANMGTECLRPCKLLPAEYLREEPFDRLPGRCRAKEQDRPLEKSMPIEGELFPQSKLSDDAMRVVLLIENMLLAKVGSSHLPMLLRHPTVHGIRLVELLPGNISQRGEVILQGVRGKRLAVDANSMDGHETEHGVRRIIPRPRMELVMPPGMDDRNIALCGRSPPGTRHVVMPVRFGHPAHTTRTLYT